MNESVKVLYAYQGQNESELTISENEILTIVEGTGDWWLVRNNSGQQGYVPSNYVEKITGFPPTSSSGFSGDNNMYSNNNSGISPSVNPTPSTQSNSSNFEKCVANHDYKASRDDELSLRKGQIVDVLEKSADGWWMGRSEGKDGWFPSNFVEVQKETSVNSNPAGGDKKLVNGNAASKGYNDLAGVFTDLNVAQKSAVKPLHTVKCLYAFDGQAGELSFQPDQVLEIIEKPENSPDWWRARDLTTGKNGLIPANYVEVVNDSTIPGLQKINKNIKHAFLSTVECIFKNFSVTIPK